MKQWKIPQPTWLRHIICMMLGIGLLFLLPSGAHAASSVGVRVPLRIEQDVQWEEGVTKPDPMPRVQYTLTALDEAPLPQGAAENAVQAVVSATDAFTWDISFSQPGVYRYALVAQAVTPSDERFLASTMQYDITIHVQQNGEGLITTVIYRAQGSGYKAGELHFTHEWHEKSPVKPITPNVPSGAVETGDSFLVTLYAVSLAGAALLFFFLWNKAKKKSPETR